jgi:DNA mismatch repair protein MutS
MRQFLEVKASHPDAIVFFRMGDFYEMFFEDAVIASQLLDLTLTSRNKGSEDAIPMAGVPHHAGRGYLARLTEQGKKVVVVEQVEDPRLAKGLVRREVVQVVTPGVVVDEEVLDPRRPRYVCAVVVVAGCVGVAALDASTGEFRAAELGALELDGELARLAPREILATAADLAGPLAHLPARLRSCAFTAIELLPARAAVAELEAALPGAPAELGLADRPRAAQAAAAALRYARATQPIGELPVVALQLYQPGDALVLDEAAVANLELTETLIGADRAGSLLAVLDDTRTAPGSRLLRRWLLYPLVDVAAIRRRQDAVAHLAERTTLRAEARELLKGIGDLERLAGRATLGVATPRDLGRLRAGLAELPALARALARSGKGLAELPGLLSLDAATLAALAELHGELGAALVDDPPPTTKDGGVIRAGFDAAVDESRALSDGGKDAILAIEERERQRTGIGTLKVKYNRVFGYYLEITKSQLARVPADYIRKQTIVNGERYVTPELAELEARVLAAHDTLVAREAELFRELVARVAARVGPLLAMAARVAAIDALASLAEVAGRGRYVRPTVDDGEGIEIVEGRHPVVERAVGDGGFVPNDCRLDTAGRQLLLITGPNMAGKSTFMRQVAHIVLMAQMGSFVPARAARIGLCDRVFTRVGAADNLARGESTFMVEMRETAAILSGATRRSLVVLDEVGRGTSTFDGVSIAWAVAEHLHDALGCRTLFATHYHELCALAESRPRVVNLSVAVREVGGKVAFLRQVIDGAANRSYGIEVARLAGLPRPVLGRAREILGELEGQDRLAQRRQLSLFSAAAAGPAEDAGERARAAEVLARLAALDPDCMTPLQALNALAELKALA